MEDRTGTHTVDQETHSETVKKWSVLAARLFDPIAFDRLVCHAIETYDRDQNLKHAQHSIIMGLACMTVEFNSSDSLDRLDESMRHLYTNK